MEKNIELYDGLGYCRYVHHLGTDRDITRAARTSYGQQDEDRTEEQDKKLLMYLYRHRHTSPFEQVNITFQIKMPIFVMRQFVRHRTFRLNEFSGRYKELPDEFYIPKKWRIQNKTNKQGSDEAGGIDHQRCTRMSKAACEDAAGTYKLLLAEGVATEMARLVLPVNVMTLIVVNCDLHNLMHFLRLRCDSHAQKEIQDLAQAMKEIAIDLFPWTMEAFDRFKVDVYDSHEDDRSR